MARVLVVDDDRLIREQARDILTQAGFEVTGLPDGKEIFDRIRAHLADVILLDLHLPGGSGLDMLPLIKGLDPELPVIIVTGHASLDAAIEALKRGAYDFIQKPFPPEQIVSAVRRAEERRRLDLRNKSLMLELSEKIHEVVILKQVGETISSTLDLRAILAALIAAARDALHSEASSLLLVEEGTGDLVFEVALGERGEEAKEFRLKRGQGIAGWVAEHGEPLCIPDATRDPRFLGDVDASTGFVTTSVLCVPLRLKGATIGVIEVMNKRGARPYDQEDQRLLQAIGSQAAVAIENAKLYRRVSQQLADLKRLEQTKDDLTQLVVHDLKAPLTSIVLNLDMLDAPEGAAAAKWGRHVGDAMRSCRSLMTLVANLLDISSMEEGKLRLTREPLALTDLVGSVVGELQVQAEEEGIQLGTDVPEDLPLVPADADLMRRVLANLLSNALEHSPPKTRIEVRAALADGSGAVQVDVTDEGEGIPEAYHQKIFEKFGQVDTARPGPRLNKGLGLTFCKLAVEAHGGRIWVQSTVGRGSTFSFTIPLQPDRVRAAAPGR
ncbi:MAG TPA: response regulator [Candidatus Methylomirabilis sp.]|jgi:K+-sensing histidine kinase KdpD|nr:response regulator [Candidatus Methylomirabilis sp.]